MFNTKVVGSANAIAAGWGNMGGGITHFLMPLIWQGISRTNPTFIAWRWAFFVPASCHVFMGIAVMLLSQVSHRDVVTCVTQPRLYVMFILYTVCFQYSVSRTASKKGVQGCFRSRPCQPLN